MKIVIEMEPQMWALVREGHIPVRAYESIVKGTPWRWIPVSESLPEEHTSVIGTTEFNDIYVTELYNDCGENKWYADGNYDVPIMAWMPLPEPYRAESEE